MNIVEMLVFAAYFVFMLGIGLYFFVKSKGAGEKDFQTLKQLWKEFNK